MNFTKFNEEVLFTIDKITEVTLKDIEFLKTQAAATQRKRIRFCSHLTVEDTLHEMLIVHTKGAYVRPHKHLNKIESFHIIEGNLDVIIFDNDGEIIRTINMSDYASGKTFYYRLSENLYHTVIPATDHVVFHETTHGPFMREATSFASWAPDENNYPAIKTFWAQLSKKFEDFTQSKIIE